MMAFENTAGGRGGAHGACLTVDRALEDQITGSILSEEEIARL